MFRYSLNFASLTLFNLIMHAKGSWIDINQYVIIQTVATMIGVDDTIEVDDDEAIIAAIRRSLLNDEGIDAFHNALVIMALFVVYTMAIDQCAIATALDLTRFPLELGDNMQSLVTAYESNLFYGDGRLEKKYRELLNLMDCGEKYAPYASGIITFAQQFAANRALV